jgi:hypothetical protein
MVDDNESTIPIKSPMDARGELSRKELPLAIPTRELQRMLGTSQAFCSWDASNSTVSDLIVGWPFLLSRPLMGTNRKPTH